MDKDGEPRRQKVYGPVNLFGRDHDDDARSDDLLEIHGGGVGGSSATVTELDQDGQTRRQKVDGPVDLDLSDNLLRNRDSDGELGCRKVCKRNYGEGPSARDELQGTGQQQPPLRIREIPLEVPVVEASVNKQPNIVSTSHELPPVIRQPSAQVLPPARDVGVIEETVISKPKKD